MIPFDLSRWFRLRMLPLVVAAALVVQIAAPLAYYVTKRHELWQEARAEAARAAIVLRGEIEQRPLLWRYNAPKLLERLAAEGLLGGRQLEIRAADGQAVPLEPGLSPRRPLWGRADVLVGGERAASVWVALDAQPLVRATAWLGGAFAGLALLLGAVLYLLPMRAIATAQRRVQALLGELALAMQEEDRRRIARDLHDGAGQALTAARLRLLALQGRAAPRPPGAPSTDDPLASIGGLLDEALGEVRRSVYALGPPALGELGLGGALQRHCEAFAAATGLTVLCEVEELPPLPAVVETACYRIVQEALTNSARHAGARRAWVQFGRGEGGLRLAIYDDGGAPEGPPAEGLGLLGIRERARLLGGRADITAAPGQGLRVEVSLPT